ncbi:MAG: hypothetical protein JNK02_11705 [Planctomycetes bacterium]|nr:hypothetical protein [Planctomycetota bacterium]
MYIETCTLGCGSGEGGVQVTCQFNQTAVNQEIAVFFSQPVDEASVSSSSFQIIDLTSGAAPNGTRFRDPNNPRKVLFRPAVSFESDGSISFGFNPDSTYRVVVPGTAQGAGPYIRSTSGSQNESRLVCDIRTSQPAVDLVPGPPTVRILVKKAITGTPNPNDFIPDVEVTPQPIVTDVWRGSDIRFEFNDLMNPATLANPSTGESAFVRVEVDLDGNLSTPDRTPLFGTYTAELDPVQLKTVMVFTPLEGIPSSGSLDPEINPNGLPRQLVITVPSNLQDLAGNSLGNPTVASVIPEYILIPPVTLPDADGENFTDTANQDLRRSSAVWGAGKLTRGQGGGRGRLGDLLVRPNETLVLNTDNQTFPLVLDGPHDILSDQRPGVNYDPLAVLTWPTVTVTDGVFEFSSLTIETGGTLRFTGTRAARVLVRGNVNILGTLDVTGSAPAPHNSTSTLGASGGAGGPNGGRGGDGATRFDYGGSSMISVGAVDVPNAQLAEDGRRGQGVGRVDEIGAGFPGVHWPTATPLGVTIGPPANADLRFSAFGFSCLSAQTGLPGGGGAYATDGLPGVASTPVQTSTDGFANLPPVGSSGLGGPASDVGIEPPGTLPIVRTLSADLGFLRGGSGGGGGGATVFGTESSDFAPNCLSSFTTVSVWRDHSAAAGGGGGGAVQLVCGGPLLAISGRIDARGGTGGSSLAAVPTDDEESELRPKRAVPGGGGSGGAIRIQALNFPSSALGQASPPRLNVSGGAGGTNTLGSVGGRGGAGLVRLEGLNVRPVASEITSVIAPTDPSIVGVDAINILSIGDWRVPRFRPESYSGAVSCWMRPVGTFFQIVFLADDPADPVPEQRYGWNMRVLFGGQEYSYRDPADSPFPGESIEQRYPNLFSANSYLNVRFQGARSAGEIGDLCNVDAATQIVPGSLTPWVLHPEELNDFSPRPNMIRFAVVFDFAATFNSPQNQIQGVTALKIRTQPD